MGSPKESMLHVGALRKGSVVSIKTQHHMDTKPGVSLRIGRENKPSNFGKEKGPGWLRQGSMKPRRGIFKN